MLVSHRTLLSDSQVTNVVPLRDGNGDVKLIAFAQGATMHILDPHEPGYPVSQSYPFMSPIVVLAPIDGDSPSVFVMLRNYNWFIFNLPDLVRAGSFYVATGCKPRRSILKRSSLLSQRPAASNPTATAAVIFAEERVAYAVHPGYLAVHIYADVIHVLPLHENTNPILVPVRSTVVDLAFMGPTDVSCRLVYISDSQHGGRELHILKLSGDGTQFVHDIDCDLPADAHSILPLQAQKEASVMVFTRDGLIRVTAPLMIPHTVEHLAAFLPKDGVILHHCHFYDDIYLMCDSCGGLSGGQFPTLGRPRTEFMKSVGSACAIVAIDSRHFIIGAPFGDSIIYECELPENGFVIKECGRIPGTGPVLQMIPNTHGLLCATGRGPSGCIRIFDRSITTIPVADIAIDGCMNIFAGYHKKILYICLCSYAGTQIVKYDGTSIKPVEFEGVDAAEPTVLFHQVSKGFIHVTTHQLRFIPIGGSKNDNDELSKEITDSVVVAAYATENYVVIVDDASVIRVVEISSLATKKKWRISVQPLLTAAYEEDSVLHVCVYNLDGTVMLFNIQSLKNPQKCTLPSTVIPISMAADSNIGTIYLGTANGHIVELKGPELELCDDHFGSSKVMLHATPDGQVVGSGSPPFLMADGRRFISASQCEDIAKVGNYLCCLHDNGVSIFTTEESLTGTSVVKLKVPGLVNFTIDEGSVKALICLVEDMSLQQSLVRYEGEKETARYLQPKERRISMFRALKLEDRTLIAIGDDSNTLTVLDSNLRIVASQKTLGMPTAACMLPQYLVVAREGAIDFYITKTLDGQYEMDRKMIANAHSLAPDLLVVNGYLLATDQQRAVTVYKVDGDTATIVSSDSQPKRLNRIAAIDNIIFASSYGPSVFCYELRDNGVLWEIGSFQCDSTIRSFTMVGKQLFYGTEAGGVGVFQIETDEDLRKIRDAIDQEDVMLLADRVPPAIFEYKQDNVFVDIDNLSVVSRVDKAISKRILKRAQVSREKYDQIIG